MANATKRATAVQRLDALPGGQGIAVMYKVFDAELVNVAADVESLGPSSAADNSGPNGFRLGDYRNYGCWIQATSVAGATAVNLKLQESWDDTPANYVTIDTGGSPINITDENPHCIQLAPVPMRFMRFQLDGQAGNSADTIVTMYLWMQS